MLNAAKPGHSADLVSAVTKKDKTLLGVEHPIGNLFWKRIAKRNVRHKDTHSSLFEGTNTNK